jgi:hypothetical protein
MQFLSLFSPTADFSVPDTNLIDWATNRRTGPNTFLTAIYVRPADGKNLMFRRAGSLNFGQNLVTE